MDSDPASLRHLTPCEIRRPIGQFALARFLSAEMKTHTLISIPLAKDANPENRPRKRISTDVVAT